MTTDQSDLEVIARTVQAKAFPKQTITAPVTLGTPIAVLNSGIGPEPDRGGCHQPEITSREHPQQPHLTHTYDIAHTQTSTNTAIESNCA